MKYTFHESLYRDDQTMQRLADTSIVICGAGALGSNLAESLARCGAKTIKVIDRDRIEEVNLSTQPYELEEVGAKKAESLSRMLYRAVGTDVEAVSKELTASNVAKLVRGADLVVDCFDNSVSRRVLTEHCAQKEIACLHVGLADGFAEVIWNEHYRVPSDAQDDICDYPLARNLVTLAVATACEAVLKYLSEDARTNWSITLRDLSISQLDM
jgi:molybdopterin/thiamine biosynthesis adenylyltransferase